MSVGEIIFILVMWCLLGALLFLVIACGIEDEFKNRKSKDNKKRKLAYMLSFAIVCMGPIAFVVIFTWGIIFASVNFLVRVIK